MVVGVEPLQYIFVCLMFFEFVFNLIVHFVAVLDGVCYFRSFKELSGCIRTKAVTYAVWCVRARVKGVGVGVGVGMRSIAPSR